MHLAELLCATWRSKANYVYLAELLCATCEVKANYVQFAERNVPSPYRSTCLPGSGEKGTQIT